MKTLFLILKAVLFLIWCTACDFESGFSRPETSSASMTDQDAQQLDADVKQINKGINALVALDLSYGPEANAIKQRLSTLRDFAQAFAAQMDSKKSLELLEREEYAQLSDNLVEAADIYTQMRAKALDLSVMLSQLRTHLEERINESASVSVPERPQWQGVVQAIALPGQRLANHVQAYLQKKGQTIQKLHHNLYLAKLYQKTYSQVVQESRVRNESRSDNELSSMAMDRYQRLILSENLAQNIQQNLANLVPGYSRISYFYIP